MKNFISIIENDQGLSVFVIVVLLLVAVTIVAIGGVKSSRVDVQISTNAMIYKNIFYGAESALEFQKVNLTNRFRAQNNPTNWNFLLHELTDAVINDDELIADDESLGNGLTYDAWIWDNDDGDSDYQKDSDRMIMLRVRISGPAARGGNVVLEALLEGISTPGQDITGYTAQQGGGAGKNYNANDKDAMTDFTEI